MTKPEFGHLEVEWHPTKNLPLTFNPFLRFRGKYWWIGPCGHEWEAVLDNRVRWGSGCPYCARKKVLAGFNDLATSHPHLAVEWHPTRNDLKPFEVIAGSHREVWWLGVCGHEWETSLKQRSRGLGCPICSSYKVLAGFNDIASHPKLGIEWHPTKNGNRDPSLIVRGSHTKFWWLCGKGHEWEVAPKGRLRGNGCPTCVGHRVVSGFNDLITTHPLLAAEWHPSKNTLTADQVIAGSNKNAWWLGVCGHEWSTAPNNRSGRGDGCPVCNGDKVLVGFNDLSTINPKIASEWHPTKNGELAANQVTVGSGKKVWWQCGNYHAWEAVVSSRAIRGRGCPICMRKQVLSGYSDLATTHPIIASEWHPTKNGDLTPEHVISGTPKIVWWVGKCGHEWQARISDRSVKGSGCSFCVGKSVLAGFNDLASISPALAAEWHPTRNGDLKAEHVTISSAKKVWWLGKCGHEWKTALSHRTNGQGCPFCVGKKILVGFNDLASINPTLASEWHPTKNGELTAEQVTVSSSKKVWWLGKCGHEWETALSGRTGGSGCPICCGHIVLVGFNDLATVNPIVAAEWHPTKNGDLLPEHFTVGSNQRVWWLGSCGHEWKTQLASRAKGSGCSRCSNNVSKAEERIKEFLDTYKLNVEISNRKILKGKEIDLWLPEKNVGIEFNGVHWHKEKYRGKDSHYDKWLACKDKGILLIQIWEDDWIAHSDIIMRTLAHKLSISRTGIIAREAKANPITDRQAENFLNENHLQGFSSGSYYLGLVETGDKEKLQAVFVLEREPDSEGKSLEIIRYASISNPSDDFSRLLAYTINAYNPESITIIADHCEANEGFYENIGFIAEKELPPDYMYVLRTERKPRSEYPMERFRDDPKLVWEEGLTEMELADLNGLNRIWDAGKTRYGLSL